MNELEKMKQGMLYDFSAPEPQQSHIECMIKNEAFNRTPMYDTEAHRRTLEALIPGIPPPRVNCKTSTIYMQFFRKFAICVKKIAICDGFRFSHCNISARKRSKKGHAAARRTTSSEIKNRASPIFCGIKK